MVVLVSMQIPMVAEAVLEVSGLVLEYLYLLERNIQLLLAAAEHQQPPVEIHLLPVLH